MNDSVKRKTIVGLPAVEDERDKEVCYHELILDLYPSLARRPHVGEGPAAVRMMLSKFRQPAIKILIQLCYQVY